MLARSGLSQTRQNELERDGLFPRRVQLTPGTVGWVESEVDEWIAARIAERDAEAA